MQADPHLVQQLVPLVLTGTEGKGCSPDFKAATFMILVQLASRAALADKLLNRAPLLVPSLASAAEHDRQSVCRSLEAWAVPQT